jgi:uncharacterized protein YndB with AHSA1/START domain
MTRPDHTARKADAVYTVFIRASAAAVWSALTSETESARYFFGRTLRSTWRVGDTWTAYLPDNAGVDTTGVVLEADPPRRLVVTWHVQWLEEARALGEAIVAYEIAPAGERVVKLQVSEWRPEGVPEKYVEGGRQGWAAILSSLKSLLETGEALAIQMKPPE